MKDPLEWIARITLHIPKKGAKKNHLLWSLQQGMAGKRATAGHFAESTNRRGTCFFDESRFLILHAQETAVGGSPQEGMGHRCLEVPQVRRRDEGHLLHRRAFCDQTYPEVHGSVGRPKTTTTTAGTRL